MADTLLSEQQVKQLIDTGNLDLTEALKLMPQTAYKLLANDLTQAIHSGDMKKINALMTSARTQISPEVYNRLQNTAQKTAYTFQVIKQVQHYQKVAEKKEQGQTLTANDNAWLDFKGKLEQQVGKVESYYPQAFNEPTAEPMPMELDNVFSTEPNANDEKTSTARMYFSDEMQSDTRNESTENIQFNPTQNAQIKPSSENTTTQADLTNTDVMYADLGNNYSADTYTVPENQTANSSEGISKYIDMYESGLNPEGLPNTIRSGNTSEMTAEAMKERETLNALQSTPKSTDEQAIQNMNDAIARDSMVSDNGYVNDFKLSDDDKRSTDWDNVFQQAGKHLQVGGEKNLDDFCMKMVTGSILAGVELLTQWLKEQHKNIKEDAKTARQKRLDYIDTNLKNKGMTMNSLASKLAKDSKLWILNDPAYENLPKTEPYTKQQKYLIQKQEFARSLPRTPNGDIDYANLSRSQKKELHSYIEDYAKSSKWKNFVYESTGITMQAEEMKKMTKDAKEMRVRVNVDELMPNTQTPMAPAYNTNNNLQQSMGNNSVQPPMPNYENNINVPQMQPASPVTAPQKQTPVTLAEPPKTVVFEKDTDSSKTTPSYQPNTTYDNTTSSTQPVAPVTALSAEEMKLRQEAQNAVKMEPLEEVNVEGSLKQPKVIRLSDGTIFNISNANLEDLKRKEEEIKRKKEANDDMRNKNREQQRMLSNVRSGKETTVQAPTQTRQAGMGGRS